MCDLASTCGQQQQHQTETHQSPQGMNWLQLGVAIPLSAGADTGWAISRKAGVAGATAAGVAQRSVLVAPWGC